MKAAYIFPGQGSQWVGMGRDLYDNFASAKTIFEQADETLGFPLSRLCFDGPEDELRQAINAQPAIVTVSFACLKVIDEVSNNRLPSPAFVAGHSLGEYTALAGATVVDFATIVYLARERGRLMYEAGLKAPGGMVAVIGLDEASLAEVCRETGTWIANINYPGQQVISGAKQDLARAEDLAFSSEVQGEYYLVTAKAMGKLMDIIPVILLFLKTGGLFVAYKGRTSKILFIYLVLIKVCCINL